jgi:glutamine cyclotransferase
MGVRSTVYAWAIAAFSEPVSLAPQATRAASSVAATSTPSATKPMPAAEPAPSGRLIASFPHDTAAFTEGLLYAKGALFESTGMYGESRLRKVDLSTGHVLAEVRLTGAYFGEGLTLLHGELVQLTYREGRAFVYDADTLVRKRDLRYEGEGWGLTTDGTRLIMSDGSSALTFRDPMTFAVTGRLPVVGPHGPVDQLNELEWVDGFVLANVWGTDQIVRIDPTTGRVVQVVDLAYLPEPRRGATPDDVLNGIAYDEAGGRLFVTGKRWSHVFQIAKPW